LRCRASRWFEHGSIETRTDRIRYLWGELKGEGQMSTLRFAFCRAIVVATLVGCSATQPDTITQVSTIDALLAGAYKGQMTCGELLSHGDLGLGTFDGLDGEMVVLGGRMYQVKFDGRVNVPAMTLGVPFACVVGFRAEKVVPIQGPTDCRGFEKAVNEAVPNPNTLLAIRSHGRFRSIRTRVIPPQTTSRPLAESAGAQAVFNLQQVEGTLVGFRMPPFVKGINMPGYHLHFVSDDRASGGHVLDFTLDSGVVEVDICNRLLMILPKGRSALQHVDLNRDRSSELNRIEK